MHSVESPSMVDTQWNIWYWGSKWNLHTVCWSAVGCEWGTTSVYFGITYVCFIPSRRPVFAVEPQYLLQYFLFLSKVSFELHIQNLQKISCWFKIWMGFVGPILIKLWTSFIWGLQGIAYANMLVTTQWPLKRAGHLTSLVWVCVLWLPWKLNGAICAMYASMRWVIIGSGNGLSPVRRQAVTRANVSLLPTGLLRTISSQI